MIVVTGHGSVPKAVEAMKAGAHSFVEKPIEPDTLLAMLERAIERRDLVGENLLLKQKLEGQFRFGNIIGKSKKMHEVLELVESVAGSDANILIQGENGTGKELIANAIHYNSKRAKGPFIKINCAAIPKDLIESELFGTRRARSPARRPTRKVCSRWRKAARCCSTRSARCRRISRRSCCACCRSASTVRSAATGSCAWISG